MCQVMPEAQARYLMARVLEHQKQPEASRMQLQLAVTRPIPLLLPHATSSPNSIRGHVPPGIRVR